MPKGKPGADNSTIVTHRIGGKTLIELSEEVYGEIPVFWGRYFKRFGNADFVQYQHARENEPLRSKNIRVLPIARQTTNVGGSEEDGTSDAQGNVEAVIRAFGREYLESEGGEFLFFLDVEGPPHSLSRFYWRGWAETVISHSAVFSGQTVSLIPCLYAPQGDDPTWQAIADEADRDVPCGGAWIARWRWRGCAGLPEWDDDLVSPRVELPCPVLLWQYADECHGGDGIDCNEINPNISVETDVLNKLILPPVAQISHEETPAGPAIPTGKRAQKGKRRTVRAAGDRPAGVLALTSEDFSTFVRSLNLKFFIDAELLTGTDRVRNGAANSFPPVELWHNIAPTIIVLDELRRRLGHAINLTSIYRNPAYNAQLEGAAGRSQHMDFRAIDFSTSAISMGDLADRARELRGLRFTIPRTGLLFRQDHAPFDLDGLDLREANGVTQFTWRGGIGEYNTFVHIDCRGGDADW